MSSASSATITSNANINWAESFIEGFDYATFTLSSNGGNFASTSFSLFRVAAPFTDEGTDYFVQFENQGNISPPGLGNIALFTSSTILGAGGIVNGDAIYGQAGVSGVDGDWANVTFMMHGILKNGANFGSDNYLAFYLNDTQGERHYGWLQFQLSPYEAGSAALTFLGGYVNDAANEAVITAVPEPSSFIYAGGALALAWLHRCRRRPSKA